MRGVDIGLSSAVVALCAEFGAEEETRRNHGTPQGGGPLVVHLVNKKMIKVPAVLSLVFEWPGLYVGEGVLLVLNAISAIIFVTEARWAAGAVSRIQNRPMTDFEVFNFI